MLLTLILLQAGGLLLVYKVQQGYIRHHMAELMEERTSRFIELDLSATDYQNARISTSEICYNGKMYDVKDVSIHEGRVILRVMNDAREEDVLQKIRSVSQDKKEQELLEQLMKLFAQVYTPVSIHYAVAIASITQPYYRIYMERPESLPQPTFYPPPRMS